jgi:hypothetical protein
MPQCPNCANNLKDEYGMQTCKKCSNVVLIDFDGNAQLGEDPEIIARRNEGSGSKGPANELIRTLLNDSTESNRYISNENTQLKAALVRAVEAHLPEESSPVSSGDDSMLAAWSSGASQNAQNPSAEQSPSYGSEAEFSDKGSSEAYSADESLNSGSSMRQASEAEPNAANSQEQWSQNEEPSPASSAEPEVNLFDMADSPANAPVPAFGPGDDPLNLNSFSNSEESQARDGLYHFRLILEGIDSKEMKELIREALQDSRFAWDVERLMTSLKKGRLVIDRMAPVKASVLVQRCKGLPIQIRWEQFSVAEGES